MQILCTFELKLSPAYISYFLQILLQLSLSLSFHLSFIYYFILNKGYSAGREGSIVILTWIACAIYFKNSAQWAP